MRGRQLSSVHSLGSGRSPSLPFSAASLVYLSLLVTPSLHLVPVPSLKGCREEEMEPGSLGGGCGKWGRTRLSQQVTGLLSLG